MKKIILASASVLFIAFTAFMSDPLQGKKGAYQQDGNIESLYKAGPDTSKPLLFGINGKYERPIKKESLAECRLLSDIIPSYPVNWISSYDSVEIMVTCNGKAIRAVSLTDALSAEQKILLKTIDLGADLKINVWYKYLNPFTSVVESNQMHVKMTAVPETEAEYVGGNGQLIKYLKDSLINKMAEIIPKEFKKSQVLFTVGEQGDIIEASISQSSGDAKTDELLLDVLHNMPRWKPAENSKGVKVKQEFILYVRSADEGC